jgi:metallo-beta-lactamase family protein
VIALEITFHGAARTVTGSQYLLQINGHKILLECGLYQGRREESYRRNRNFLFDPEEVEALILSHAHIDHSGNLPNLVKNGFRGPIYTTSATAHLANIMLMDSGHIQEIDAATINHKHAKRGEPPVEPLYTLQDAAQVAQQFRPVSYDQSFEVTKGVGVTLVDAGHILGSAAIVLDVEENGRYPSRKKRLWFSGDIGRRDLPLIRDPVLPSRADIMMMECTYGDKPHENPQLAVEELRQAVSRTIQRGGKVIIPSFAVGRTQDLVYDLNVLIEKGEIPRNLPVYVDSPLAVNASDIFREHPECFDEETRQFIAEGRHREALGFDRLTYVRSVEESKALNERKDPMIIISASGMAENGRIRHHLKNNIEDRRNTILIVSWQAPDTLGRRLAERQPQVTIFGEVYQLKAEVVTIGGLSAHAGQNFLVEYARATRETVRQIFLVHGEAKPAEALTEKLRQIGIGNIAFPDLHSTVEI